MFFHAANFPARMWPRRNFNAELLVNNPYPLSEEHSLLDLITRMVSPDREIYESYKLLKVEVAFQNRIFIIYKPTGLTADRRHRPPEILTQVRVNGFRADARTGAEVDIEDLTTHQTMTIGYIPKRLFDYDVFLSVAPRQRLQWDAHVFNGTVSRSMSFMLMCKIRSRGDYYSHGATGIETPTKFRELFPDVNLTLLAS